MKTISGHVMQKDVIVLRDGRVQSLDNYTGYGGVLYYIYSVKRLELDDIFYSSLDGPDHGTSKQGSLADVLSLKHKTFRPALTRLFGLVNPTDDEIFAVVKDFGISKKSVRLSVYRPLKTIQSYLKAYAREMVSLTRGFFIFKGRRSGLRK